MKTDGLELYRALASSIAAVNWPEGEGLIFADRVEAALKSAVRAIMPGRQQKKGLDPLMRDALRVFVRTLRRTAKS